MKMTILLVAVLAAFPVWSVAGEEQPELDIKALVREKIETVTAEDAAYPGPKGRGAAIRFLAQHPEESSAPVLDALEKNEDSRARLWILLCINSFNDISIFDPGADTIVKLLDDQSFGTKFWAIKTVAKMKALSAVPALTELLRSDTYLFREAAATALGRIGGQAPIEELIKLLKDPEHMVRRAVVEALGELKPPGSKAHLIGALKDSEQNLVVRRAIVGALEKITDSSFDIDPSEWYAPGAGDKRAAKIKEWLENNK